MLSYADDMEQLLKQVGFSEKEAKVYLASLALGKDTAFHIAKKAGLKRPTVYLILEELVQKGFISLTKTKKAKLYGSTHPKKILTSIQSKERKFREGLVELESLYNAKLGKPRMETFEGIRSVESLYDEITDYARLKGKEVLAFGTVAFLRTIHKQSYDYWLSAIGNKRCHIREILNADKENQPYIHTVKKIGNPHHKIRLITENFQVFKNDNLIYENKVALFSSQRDFFVIVIESQDLVDSFKAFFELAWKTAKEVG